MTYGLSEALEVDRLTPGSPSLADELQQTRLPVMRRYVLPMGWSFESCTNCFVTNQHRRIPYEIALLHPGGVQAWLVSNDPRRRA